MERVKRFSLDESGAAAVEYGLLLISVFIATALSAFGISVRALFTLFNDNFS